MGGVYLIEHRSEIFSELKKSLFLWKWEPINYSSMMAASTLEILKKYGKSIQSTMNMLYIGKNVIIFYTNYRGIFLNCVLIEKSVF